MLLYIYIYLQVVAQEGYMAIVPILNYGQRTGVTTLKKLVHHLCGIYDAFKPTIDAWVNDNMTPENAAVVMGWLNLLHDVCSLVDVAPDD